jgi:KDO2-lipid IV(A) lauroyltransferase
MGVETLSSKALPISAFRHLRRNGFLGVLADQRIQEGGVVVSFLGQPTRMTDAPARLAMATGAPVVPMGIRRLSHGRHLATVLPPLRSGESPGEVTDLTQAVASSLEQLIRAAPEEWMWIHPRWEDMGPDTPGGLEVKCGSGEQSARESKEEEMCVSR